MNGDRSFMTDSLNDEVNSQSGFRGRGHHGINVNSRDPQPSNSSCLETSPRWCKGHFAGEETFPPLSSTVVCVLIWLVLPSLIWAETSQYPPAKPLALAELPSPPEEVMTLLRQGDVTMNYGDRDPDLEPKEGPRIAAETRFKMQYHYRSAPRWFVRNLDSGRVLRIRLRLSELKLETTHEIWFRQRPGIEDFWQDPLVQHELDHVRISSDVRLAKRFDSLVRDSGWLQIELAGDEDVDAGFVRRVVKKHVADSFEQVSDLASIRYQELDRLSSHGRRRVPTDFRKKYLTGEETADPKLGPLGNGTP